MTPLQKSLANELWDRFDAMDLKPDRLLDECVSRRPELVRLFDEVEKAKSVSADGDSNFTLQNMTGILLSYMGRIDEGLDVLEANFNRGDIHSATNFVKLAFFNNRRPRLVSFLRRNEGRIHPNMSYLFFWNAFNARGFTDEEREAFFGSLADLREEDRVALAFSGKEMLDRSQKTLTSSFAKDWELAFVTLLQNKRFTRSKMATYRALLDLAACLSPPGELDPSCVLEAFVLRNPTLLADATPEIIDEVYEIEDGFFLPPPEVQVGDFDDLPWIECTDDTQAG